MPIQALIACQRYKDAEARAELLTDGVDKLYLQAETLWRQGSLEAALACLLRAGQITPESSKCQELQNWLLSVQDKCYIIRLALEDGESFCQTRTTFSKPTVLCYASFDQLPLKHECTSCMCRKPMSACNAGQAIACQEQCSGLLSEVQPEACSGLYAHILHQQAQAFLQRQQYKEALQSLKQAFVWEPNHHGCLLLQALVSTAVLRIHNESHGTLQVHSLYLRCLAHCVPCPGLADPGTNWYQIMSSCCNDLSIWQWKHPDAAGSGCSHCFQLAL